MKSGPGGEKQPRTTQTKSYNGQPRKEMNCDESHLRPNEKTQPIQCTEGPTGALVAAGSLWPSGWDLKLELL